MKLATGLFLFNLFLTTLCAPTPPSKRSGTDYINLYTTLTSLTYDFTTYIESYAGGVVPGTVVQDQADILLLAFNNALATIYTLPLLNSAETIALANPILDTQDAVYWMIDNLVAVRAQLISDGLNYGIADFLYYLRSVMGDIRDQTAYKVPGVYAQAIWDALDDIYRAIENGLIAYSF
ncbi:hypothetical protein BJX63DRAFT_434778 [Aspergillus granulosus]|uniref:Uncharacterized protein n=1 Tax=Aspergillus granulosus TaxID=176169 RepID=A0ABR4H3B5_9EURO